MIKKGTIRDLEMIDRLTIMIIKDMKKSNIPQWNYPYPRYKVFMRDLLKNGLFVMKDAHFIQGSITVLPENDKAYLTIDSWQGKNALVIHRFMVDPRYRNQGVASKLLEYAIKLANAFNCEVSNPFYFSRKSYFYPDLTKNFQTTQKETPIGKGGFIDVYYKGKKITIRLIEIHIEEDVAQIKRSKNNY